MCHQFQDRFDTTRDLLAHRPWAEREKVGHVGGDTTCCIRWIRGTRYAGYCISVLTLLKQGSAVDSARVRVVNCTYGQ